MLYKSVISMMLLALLYGCGNGGGVATGPLTFKASSVYRENVTGCQTEGAVIINARLSNQTVQNGTKETVCGTRLPAPKAAKITNKETNATFRYILNVIDDSEEIEKFCLKDDDNNSYLGVYITGTMLDASGEEAKTPFHENTICLAGPKKGDSSDNDTDIGDNTTTPDDNGTVPPEVDPELSGTVIIAATAILPSYTFTGRYDSNPSAFPAKGTTTEIRLRNIGKKSLFLYPRMGSQNPDPIVIETIEGNTDEAKNLIDIKDSTDCAPNSTVSREIKGGEYCRIIIAYNGKTTPTTETLAVKLRVRFTDGTSVTSRIGVSKTSEGFYQELLDTVGGPTMNVSSYLPSTAVIKNDIYLFTTSNIVSLTNKLYSFNIETHKWTELPSPEKVAPETRHSPAMAAIGYNIYFFGNTNNVTPNETNDFFMYNTKTKVWKKLEVKPSNLISSRYGATMTAVGTRLYLFGGMDNDTSPVNDNNLYFYDAITDEWGTVKTDMPMSARGYMNATLDGNTDSRTIYFFGGITYDPRTNKRMLDTKLYSFDLRNLYWQAISPRGVTLQDYSVATNRFSMLLSPRFIILTGGRTVTEKDTKESYAVQLPAALGQVYPLATWVRLSNLSNFDFKNTVSVSINGMNYIFKFDKESEPVKVYSYYPGDRITK